MAKEYIEREAALKEAQEVYHWCGHENRYSDFVPVDAIRAIPAADVVEVKHGRWETYPHAYGFERCSVCHDCNIWGEWADGKKWGYCPNCGAKMDGERVALEEVVDIDAQTQRNNAAMRRVIDFVMDGGNQ